MAGEAMAEGPKEGGEDHACRAGVGHQTQEAQKTNRYIRAVVAPGQLSAWADVDWAVVGASLVSPFQYIKIY